MNEILRRNHDIYMRIEKFEDYEFFNCIAYEMFQRSIGIEPLNIQKQYQENSKGYLIQGYDNLGNIKLTSTCSLEDYIFSIFPSLYDDLLNKLKKENPNLGDKELNDNVMNMSISIEYIIEKYLKKEDIPFNEIIYKTDEGKRAYLTKKKLIDIIKNTNYSYNIVSNFKYKYNIINNYKFINLLNLNLALPKKELVAYLTKIKDDFDRNELVLDTPSEILHKDYINKTKITLQESIINRHDKIKVYKKNGEIKYEIDPYTILNSKENMADALYIYDQEELNYSKNEILDELLMHHDKFDSDRYDKYLKFAKKFIEEEAYKNLIK